MGAPAELSLTISVLGLGSAINGSSFSSVLEEEWVRDDGEGVFDTKRDRLETAESSSMVHYVETRTNLLHEGHLEWCMYLLTWWEDDIALHCIAAAWSLSAGPTCTSYRGRVETLSRDAEQRGRGKARQGEENNRARKAQESSRKAYLLALPGALLARLLLACPPFRPPALTGFHI